MADHHTESERFLQHVAREAEAGRPLPGRMELDSAAVSARLTVLYHHYYTTAARTTPASAPAHLTAALGVSSGRVYAFRHGPPHPARHDR